MSVNRPARAPERPVYEPPPWERREREAAARPETDASRAWHPSSPPSRSGRPYAPGAGLSSDGDGDELAPLGKHCWVVDAPGHSGRWPGLLLEWRRDPSGGEWAGRARYPGHMIHVDVEKVGRIPDGGGWRAHGRGSAQRRASRRAAQRAHTKNTNKAIRTGYVFLHSALYVFSASATP